MRTGIRVVLQGTVQTGAVLVEAEKVSRVLTALPTDTTVGIQARERLGESQIHVEQRTDLRQDPEVR